jgi:hypothetical protein
MELRHLTEEEIQGYLDNIPNSVNKFVEEHLRSCQLCQKALEGYRRLYAGLKTDKGFELCPDFTEKFFSKLSAVPASKSRLNYTEILLVILGLVAGICIPLYFMGWKHISQKITAILQPQINLMITSWNLVEKVLQNLHINMNLLLLSGLTLLIVYLLDYIFFRKKVHFFFC